MQAGQELPKNKYEALRVKLLSQVRIYPQQDKAHGIADLSVESRAILYKDWHDFLSKGMKSVTQYREAFINYVLPLLQDKKNYSKDGKVHSFEEILGKEGLALFQQALKEETQDRQYRDAVFNEATHFVPGGTWEKPVSAIISGPSASGKSHATKRVIEQLAGLPKKTKDGQIVAEGNLLTSIDGGIFREVSQMRKLAIRVANELGYPGIKDLHKQCEKPLERVRAVVTEATLKDPKFGVVLPETYSTWLSPFSTHKEFMATLIKGKNLIFTQVVGAQDNFKDVVKFMGENRAWKNDASEVIIDLNSTANLKESKDYPPTGFYFGKLGSEAAFDYYVDQLGTKALTIKIPNDLILLKQDPATKEWGQAQSTDKGVIIISQTVYEAWKKSDKSKDLQQFAKDKPLELPLELSNALKQLLANAPKAAAQAAPAAQQPAIVAQQLPAAAQQLPANAQPPQPAVALNAAPPVSPMQATAQFKAALITMRASQPAAQSSEQGERNIKEVQPGMNSN